MMLPKILFGVVTDLDLTYDEKMKKIITTINNPYMGTTFWYSRRYTVKDQNEIIMYDLFIEIVEKIIQNEEINKNKKLNIIFKLLLSLEYIKFDINALTQDIIEEFDNPCQEQKFNMEQVD